MENKKYKVKNCPNFDDRIWQEPTCNINPRDCQDCNCLLKQVIDSTNPVYLTKEVLSLLEIEEVRINEYNNITESR